MSRKLTRTGLIFACVLALMAVASPTWAEESGPLNLPDRMRAIFETETAVARPVPPLVRDSFVAAEDPAFFAQNAPPSAITQRLAKWFALPGAGILASKARELTLTLTLEKTFERHEILAWYLHRLYLGRGCYGVQAASQAYFGVEPEAMSLAQAAQLATLASAPTIFDPLREPEKTTERRNLVLAEMVEAGFVAKADAEKAAAAPLDALTPRKTCAD
jgi:Transglycosylase